MYCYGFSVLNSKNRSLKIVNPWLCGSRGFLVVKCYELHFDMRWLVYVNNWARECGFVSAHLCIGNPDRFPSVSLQLRADVVPKTAGEFNFFSGVLASD